MVLLCFLLAGCNGGQPPEKSETEQQQQTVSRPAEAADDVLATVNGTAITQKELEQAIVRMVDEETASSLDNATRKKIVESLVLSRAMSQAREKEMTGEEKKHLQRQVKAYREQLLVRQYIAAHSARQPVSEEEIKEYYAAYPERFGARTIRKYEMITTRRPLTSSEKDDVLQRMDHPEKHEDWGIWAKNLAAMGYPVVHRQGRDDEKLLHSALAGLLSSLTMEQSPQLLMIREIPYLVRLRGIEKIPAKPLQQVASNIRKTLARQQIRKAVEEAGEAVLSKAEVEYVD